MVKLRVKFCYSGNRLLMILLIGLNDDWQGSGNGLANINVMWEIYLNVNVLIAGISLTR